MSEKFPSFPREKTYEERKESGELTETEQEKELETLLKQLDKEEEEKQKEDLKERIRKIEESLRLIREGK